MPNMKSVYSVWTPRMLSILRIVAALLFMQHGAQKLFDMPSSSQGGTVPLLSMIGVAGILEFFGGLLVFLGLCTRPVAFILAGEMAVAYFMVHSPQSFWPIINRGEMAVLYCFVFLYLAFAGGGVWSIDHLRKGDKLEHQPGDVG